MQTEESTPIAARMSKADIMQFQERKAWYEECKRNTIPCTIEDIDFTEETKHEIWLTFLYSPLKRYIVEGKVVIRPDDEQRTEILLNNSQVNYPDIADKEYCHMLLELVKTAVFHLYISKDKTYQIWRMRTTLTTMVILSKMCFTIALSVATKIPSALGGM